MRKAARECRSPDLYKEVAPPMKKASRPAASIAKRNSPAGNFESMCAVQREENDKERKQMMEVMCALAATTQQAVTALAACNNKKHSGG